MALPARGSSSTSDGDTQRRFEEREHKLRAERLNSREKSLNRWFSVVGIVLAAIGVYFAFFSPQRFQEFEIEARRHVDEAQEAAKEIKKIRDEARAQKEEMESVLVPKDSEKTIKAITGAQKGPEVSSRVARAIKLQEQGDIEEAIKEWRVVAEGLGEGGRQLQAQVWYLIGSLESERTAPDWEAVIYAYTKSIESGLDDVTAYNNRGVAKANLGQYRAALADYDRALALDPNNATAYNNRGVAKANLGQYRAALADYDRALVLDQDLAKAYMDRGLAKHNLGQNAEALADFDRALALDPNNATAYTGRGAVKHDLVQYPAALVDYDRALALDPTNVAAYVGRGDVRRHLGQYTAALADFDRALALDPDSGAAYHNRALVMQRLGRIDEAIADYQTALTLAEKSGDENAIATARRNLRALTTNAEP